MGGTHLCLRRTAAGLRQTSFTPCFIYLQIGQRPRSPQLTVGESSLIYGSHRDGQLGLCTCLALVFQVLDATLRNKKPGRHGSCRERRRSRRLKHHWNALLRVPEERCHETHGRLVLEDGTQPPTAPLVTTCCSRTKRQQPSVLFQITVKLSFISLQNSALNPFNASDFRVGLSHPLPPSTPRRSRSGCHPSASSAAEGTLGASPITSDTRAAVQAMLSSCPRTEKCRCARADARRAIDTTGLRLVGSFGVFLGVIPRAAMVVAAIELSGSVPAS